MSSKSQLPASVLIVEDDQNYADKFVCPHFELDWRVTIAYNVPQGLKALDAIDDLRLAIVDLDLPGGSQDIKKSGGAGFEVIEVIKQRFPMARVVLLTAYLSEELVNRAQSLKTEYVSKSGCEANLREIAEELWVAARAPAGKSTVAAARRVARTHKLSDRQTQVLLLLVEGYSRRELVDKLAISRWTLKIHVGHLLKKTGAGRTQELIATIRKTSR